MYLPDLDADGEAHAPHEPGPAARISFGITVGAAVLGVTMILGAAGEQPAAGPPRPDTGASGAGQELTRPEAVAEPLVSAVPRGVSVPGIGVAAPVVRVGLDAAGWVAGPPPGQEHLAGWYEGAVTPGERGTAVLVGHVDGATGPAVFYELGALVPGDAVEVTREDGVVAEFTVYEVAVFDKHRLPTRVYRDTDRAELRLMTCGGPYQESTGYEDNIVVFAGLSGTR